VRTLPSRLRALAVVLLVLGAASALASPAAAQGSGCGEDGCVDVVAVEGVIDEIEADFIVESVRSAARAPDVVGVVLQMDSPGVAVRPARLDEVARAIEGSGVPVSVWVGASGAEVLGGAVELVQVAASSSITPGSVIGKVGSQRLSESEFGRLFAGESMFHRATDASKVALVHLVDWLRATGTTLLDVQWTTPHLASLGAVDMPRAEYLRELAEAVA